MNEKAYYESVNTKNELKLRELQKELPPILPRVFYWNEGVCFVPDPIGLCI